MSLAVNIRLWKLLVILALAGTLLLMILVRTERILVVEQPPRVADAIVLLGGGKGDRVEKAVELFSKGYASKILVTGKNESIQSAGTGWSA